MKRNTEFILLASIAALSIMTAEVTGEVMDVLEADSMLFSLQATIEKSKQGVTV